jgi:uncharacterized protein
MNLMPALENPMADWPKLQPWAVVGVSADPEKYGHKIYHDLKQAGYRVYGINPKLSKLEGDPCYPDLASLPELPAVVNVVVPPKAAMGVIEACIALGLKRVWFQPGAEDEAAIATAEAAGITVLSNACILLEKQPVASP